MISSTPRYGMTVDARTCVGCTACVIACKSENEVPDGFARRWVTERVQGRFPDLKMRVWSECCHHCDDAPCVSSCPTGASYVDADTGTTQVDPQRCTGCKACIASCPYDARYVRPEGFIDKCTLCAHRLEAGRRTACEEICPTASILVGNLGDSSSEIRRLVARRPSSQRCLSAGTHPRLFILE